MSGQVPLKFALALDTRCTVRADGLPIKADSRDNGVSHFSVQNHAIDELTNSLPAVSRVSSARA